MPRRDTDEVEQSGLNHSCTLGRQEAERDFTCGELGKGECLVLVSSGLAVTELEELAGVLAENLGELTLLQT